MSAIACAIVPRMKTLLVVIATLGIGCTAQRPAKVARPTVSSSAQPACREIPTLTGKPMRCMAVPPDELRRP